MSEFVNPLAKYPLDPSSPGMTRWRSTTRHSMMANTGPATPSKPRQRTRQVSKSVSPARRRVTRSQSRELEAAGLKNYDLDADVAPVAGAGRRVKGRAKRKQDELAVVPEEPPVITPPKPGPQLDTEVIPESPEEEDPANISGTTVFPTDSDAEAGDLDPVLMIDALPDLHRASDDVLEFLIPRHTSQESLTDMVKRLHDPRSSESRRLKRLQSNFSAQAEYFGFDNQTYIDVGRVARVLPSVNVHGVSGDSEDRRWHVDGILHKANCARFALEVLTVAAVADRTEPPVRNLEGKFPSPFMNGLFGDAGEDNVGISDLTRATFNLALEIRTQFLKNNLRKDMLEESFNPEAILRYVFFNEPLGDEDDEQLSLRGFNLTAFQDENGDLPDRFQRPVYDRINDIRRCFVDSADGPVDFKRLDVAYPWNRFRFQVAEWIRKRNEEVNEQLTQQPATDKVRDVLHQEVDRRASFGRTAQVLDQEQEVENEIIGPGIVEEIQEAVSQHRHHESLSAAERKKKRRSSKGFLTRDSVRRLSMREREAIPDTPEDAPRYSNERSGPARSVSPPATRESTASARGQSASALPVEQRPTQERRREISVSVEPVLRANDEPISDALVADRRNRDTVPSPSPAETTNLNLRAIWNKTAKSLSNTPNNPKDTRQKAVREFIDRQDNATRVSPISLSSGTPAAQQHNARKRKRTEEHDDESEDEEFSRDERAVDVMSRRAQKPEQRPKRPRLFNYNDFDDGPDQQLQTSLHDELTRSTAAQGRDTSSSPRSSMTATSRAVNTQQRPATQSRTSVLRESERLPPRAPRPAVARRRWTAEETERLITLVGRHGISWAQIKREDDLWPTYRGGPKLQGRTQIQLKDKARNIVNECIRTGSPFPKNFEQVTLKEADLKRYGVI